jgi:hypothetical protein
MKPLHLGMAAAVAVLAGLLLFDRPPADAEIAEAVVRPAPAAPVRAPAQDARAPGAGPDIGTLVPRDQLIGEPGDGPDVFGSHNWNPPPPPAPPVQNLPPPAPVAPPLPFSVLGKAAAAGGLEVYLARGDKTLIVRKGDVVDGVYRVDAIAPPMMTLTYLPLNQVQQMNIGVLE